MTGGDSTRLCAAFAELTALADRPGFAGEACVEFVSLLEAGARPVLMKIDWLPAGRAGEVTMRLQPSDLLDRFVAAVRAGERDREIVESILAHIESLLPETDDPAPRGISGQGGT